MSARLEAVLAEVVAWGRETFPQSTDASKVAHLLKEVKELERQPSSPEEMADVLMILAHLAGAHNVDLAAEISRKLSICREREWGGPDADGVVEHVRERPTWDAYWFDMARLVSTRATCPRAHIGAVLVKFNRIVSVGYNGVPEGEPHCLERESLDAHAALIHCPWSRHAEANCLRNAFSNPYGATLYGVGARTICPNCSDRLKSAGVTDTHWSER